jgi:heme exporter protein A
MTELAIEAEHLSRRFGHRWALADVSFQVPRGTVMMVAGPNGSGKSTLLRVLSAILRPDQGHATVSGFDIVKHRLDVRKSVALLSHYSYLYESLTARENLEVFADHMGTGRASIMSLLDRVALGARSGDFVSTFSAGMRKRLSFARILLQDPSVVFLDEPYGQLDPEGFALVDDVVRELKSRGVTVVMATHQIERASSLADQSLSLAEGRVQR